MQEREEGGRSKRKENPECVEEGANEVKQASKVELEKRDQKVRQESDTKGGKGSPLVGSSCPCSPRELQSLDVLFPRKGS